MARGNLKNMRKTHNLSQEEFAKKIGLSRTLISALEVGRSNPRIDTAIKIAKFYKVEVAEFENLFKKDDNK